MLFTGAERLIYILLMYAAAIIAAQVLLRISPWFRAELSLETQSRVRALDGLRGLLCIGVFAHHGAIYLQQTWYIGEWRKPESTAYELIGKLAVALFFCATSFLFWGRALRAKKRGGGRAGDWIVFFRGRLLRVAPMYLVSAAVCVAVTTLNRHAPGISSQQWARLVLEILTLGVLRWSPIAVDGTIVFPEEANAGVHWSLRYEWAFYLALPILTLLLRRFWYVAIYAAWIVILARYARQSEAPKACVFVIGMIAAHAAAHPNVAAHLRKPIYSLLVLAGVCAVFALSVPRFSPTSFALTGSAFSSFSNLCMLAIFVPIACGNTVFGVLSWASLGVLGLISYSVYLIHGIVLFVARPLIFRIAEPAGSANWPYWILICGLAVVVVAISAMTYRYVEMPFIRVEHRLRKREKLATPVGTPPVP